MITRSLHMSILGVQMPGCPPGVCRLLRGWLCLRLDLSRPGSRGTRGLPLQLMLILNQRILILNINITRHSQEGIRAPASTVIFPWSDLVRPEISSRIKWGHTSSIFCRVRPDHPAAPWITIITNNLIIENFNMKHEMLIWKKKNWNMRIADWVTTDQC